jgi:hypothetical protein
MRNVSDDNCAEYQNTFCVQFFFENYAVYEIMWENIVDPGRSQMTMQYGTNALHAG